MNNGPTKIARTALYFDPDDYDPEHTERIIILPEEFPYQALRTVGLMLEDEGVFIPGYIPPKVGVAHPDSFIYESKFSGIKTTLLPDRNIVSRMAKIANGITMDPMLRKVAAIKAFSHFLDIEVDPSISFHELAQTQGNNQANHELSRFRDADNSSPEPWLELAFNTRQYIDPLPISAQIEAHDFEFPLRRWRRNYIASLKIAEIEFYRETGFRKICRLLSWMRDDFMICGAAILLACIYFAPKSAPRRGLLKHLRSPDRLRAIDGIRNAAWDLTHLSDMSERVNRAYGTERRILFASFDSGLRTIARMLFSFAWELNPRENLVKDLSIWWPLKEAASIGDTIIELMMLAQQPERKAGRLHLTKSIDDLIMNGEDILISLPGIADQSTQR